MISAHENPSLGDRRVEIRFAIHCPVECVKYSVMKESKIINAVVKNLSSEGLCLKLDRSLLVGTNLCIRCDGLSSCADASKLPTDIAPVLTVSEVKWCRTGKDYDSECYYAGVKHLTGDYD